MLVPRNKEYGSRGHALKGACSHTVLIELHNQIKAETIIYYHILTLMYELQLSYSTSISHHHQVISADFQV